MAAENAITATDSDKVLAELAELRRWSGAPREFWPHFLASVGKLAHARKVSLLFKDASEPPRWQSIQEWSSNTGSTRFLSQFTMQLSEIAERCAAGNEQIFPQERMQARGPGQWVIAARLQFHRPDGSYVIACLLPEETESSAREALVRLNLIADVPASYQVNQLSRIAKADVEKFAIALDLMVTVNTEKKFLAAALALCNGLATRLACERVSLGWLQGGYVRLKAISRTEKFNRQMAAAQSLEAAMDECLDQDEEILWPAPAEGATFVARDHEKFSREQKVPHLCSLPLREDTKAVAVLTCERTATPFSALEVQQLRLCCDQAARRMADLQRRDRWFGARCAAWWKEQFAVLVGPKHTWAKATSILVAILLGVLFFVRVPYRIEGNFVLKSDEVQFRTAPFEGYIEQVFVRPGDAVKTGDKLLKLMTKELELEESSALAELGRYQREAEKARATNGLADMRVALALADQSAARLDLVRHRLNEATLKAPFDGVIVEGDLRERLAAPVKQGDALMKIARIENLYVEAEVNERDIHEILGNRAGSAVPPATSLASRSAGFSLPSVSSEIDRKRTKVRTQLASTAPNSVGAVNSGGRGEIAFVSQPRLKFPIHIVKLEPAAFPRQEGNVFLVRCEFDHAVESWWRPGMSGLCKLSIEGRTLWWILTHRTVDFLRMKLWW